MLPRSFVVGVVDLLRFPFTLKKKEKKRKTTKQNGVIQNSRDLTAVQWAKEAGNKSELLCNNSNITKLDF